LVREHRDCWPVEGLHHVLQVSTRGYRAWASRATSQRDRMDIRVLGHMRRQAETAIFQYINGLDNLPQRRSYLGGITPSHSTPRWHSG
jgi:hypothetical protein